jgi:hypothetical protein
MNEPDMFFYAFPVLFIGMWFTITRVLRHVSGMTPQLEIETGELVRASRWGSASINGVNAQRCVKLEEYREGYVVRMMWIFGGGRLWLPKRGLQVSEERPGRFWMPRSRVLISGMNQVILLDKLTAFVAVPSTDALARR